MIKYISYVFCLILWSMVLNRFEKNEIESMLNIITLVLMFILYELIEMNNNKDKFKK